MKCSAQQASLLRCLARTDQRIAASSVRLAQAGSTEEAHIAMDLLTSLKRLRSVLEIELSAESCSSE